METENIDIAVRDAIQEIVADTVEVDVAEVGWTTHFWDELGADSLQGIEILSALERRFHITIDQSLLAGMQDVQSTYEVVKAALQEAGSDGG
jgi:acyl carrier protein